MSAAAKRPRATKRVSSAPPAQPGDRTLKTSELVAERIVRDIRRAGMSSGDPLPSEAAMLAEYRVSRTSLREALRILEVQGLITMRFGPRGGPSVGEVDPRHLARTYALFLHFGGETYADLYTSWIAFEGLCAELAARNPQRDARRAALERFTAVDAFDVDGALLESGVDFHGAVFQLVGNRAITLPAESIAQIVRTHVLSRMDLTSIHQFVVDDHRGIAQAIIAGRPQRARALAEEHFGRLVGYFEANWPELSHELIEWR